MQAEDREDPKDAVIEGATAHEACTMRRQAEAGKCPMKREYSPVILTLDLFNDGCTKLMRRLLDVHHYSVEVLKILFC